MQGPLTSHLQPDEGVFETGPISFDILMMGNSYTSANSLDSLVDGVMNAASNPANVTSLTGGGMRLSQHSSNVGTAGHQWNNTLNNGAWNWVVLQDQSQIPGFPRSQQEWIDSKNGAVQLAQTIDDKGADSVLMMTWGRRDGDSMNTQRFPDFSTMQDELEAGYLDYRDNMSSNGDVWIAPVGLAFEYIHDKIVADGGTPTNSGNTFYNLYSGDGSHPSLSGSYLAAVVIYATITGDDPVGLSHSTSLSNSLVLELQQAASATVFNETSHLDYPWQGNSQNQLPPINLSAIPDGALAFEWVEQRGAQDEITINDVTIDVNETIFAAGNSEILSLNSTIGPCEFPQDMLMFVIKMQPNGHCSWVANVTLSGAGSVKTGWAMNSITHDFYGNSYVVGTMTGSHTGQSKTYTFNENISFTLSSSVDGKGFVGKINPQGEWQWVKILNGTTSHSEITSIDANMQGDIIVGGRYGAGLSTHAVGSLIFDSLTIPSSNSGYKRAIFVASISESGVWNWAKNAIHNYNSGYEDSTINGLVIDSNGNTVVTGFFSGFTSGSGIITFGTISLTIDYNNVKGTYVAKIDSNGVWQWAQKFNSHTSANYGYSIDTDSNGDIFIAGEFYGDVSINSTTISAGGNSQCFVGKLLNNGSWDWLKEVDSSGSACYSIATDVHDNALVTGKYNKVANFGGIQLPLAGGNNDIFLAKINGTGDWKYAMGAGTGSDDDAKSIFSDRNGNAYLSGKMEVGAAKYGPITKQNAQGIDWFIGKLTSDYDADGEPDSIDDDDDGDYIIDIYDKCQYSANGFESIAAFDHDSDGCRDSDEDYDDDDDGLNDSIDSCPKGMTGWSSSNVTDLDSDGCMDALEDYDDDADGFEDYEDLCQRIPGNSTMEYEKGCPDSDGDGRPDILDPFPNDASEWQDTDGDGVGNNSDAFPLDATQQSDIDGDGYGDEEYGNGGDSCPMIFGNSTIDRKGCIDSDGDGWSDFNDDFPNDPAIHLDTDGDTIPDHLDDFPFDPTQWSDSDGDGYGDNANGNLGDVFPNDPSRHFDSDRDGVDDLTDDFPFDPTQWEDADGDGMGDNPMGIGADHFPNDPTQWGDIDGDGYGDNQSGNNPDDFPIDATQWSDFDGDGYGDNPSGRLYDLFPSDGTQWEDADGDGLGDNLTGDNADPYLNDFDNDGYPDSMDILPKLYSPGDLDNDGCFDDVDVWPTDMNECFDFDGDGIGDNEDPDDDGDGWADTDERRLGTNPFDANEVPVDSFEIVIPGTAIGLGAWDLIGMFGGIPLFSWIGYGFATRNGRCERYVQELNAATTRKELEEIAIRSEYSLMLRMLGPHQGIKLERLRAELDDELEREEHLIVQGFDQTNLVEVNDETTAGSNAKAVPEINTGNTPAASLLAEKVDDNGFEWVVFEGQNWYRIENSNAEWIIFES